MLQQAHSSQYWARFNYVFSSLSAHNSLLNFFNVHLSDIYDPAKKQLYLIDSPEWSAKYTEVADL